MLILTNYSNLSFFMKIKSLSSRQVWWLQKLSQYYFQIYYCHGKTKRATNALSRFFHRSDDKEEKLPAKNFQIFHRLQASLINASLSNLSVLSNFLPLHQILICETNALTQLCQFWNMFRAKLVNKRPYKASIGSMRLKLEELQKTDPKAQKLRSKNGYQKVNGMIHHQDLPFVPKALQIELISRYYGNPLAGHFGIKKTHKLFA